MPNGYTEVHERIVDSLARLTSRDNVRNSLESLSSMTSVSVRLRRLNTFPAERCMPLKSCIVQSKIEENVEERLKITNRLDVLNAGIGLSHIVGKRILTPG